MKLKPYVEVPCPYIDVMRKEVLDWLEQNTDYLTNEDNPHLDRVVDYVDLAKKCPSILKFAKDLRVPFRDLQFTIIPKHRPDYVPLPLHVNEAYQNIKINIPILNATDSYVTEWYDVPQEDLDTYPKFRREYWRDWEPLMIDLRTLDPVVHEKYPLAGSYSMIDVPIVFNAFYPHRVRCINNYSKEVFPRILLSAIPHDERALAKYLE